MNLTTLHPSTLYDTYKPYKPRVLMPMNVYADILTLVHNYSSEIGWQGYVRRDRDTYVIEEILIYPQLVTGVTVKDKHNEYAAWIGQIPIEKLNAVRLYAHSHVNMRVDPSAVDLNQFETYKSQTDDFYIMMIVNKKNEFRIDIYDKAKDTTYVGCEFLISYPENKELLAEARRVVERQTYPAYGYGHGYPYSQPYIRRGNAQPFDWDDYFNQLDKAPTRTYTPPLAEEWDLDGDGNLVDPYTGSLLLEHEDELTPVQQHHEQLRQTWQNNKAAKRAKIYSNRKKQKGGH